MIRRTFLALGALALAGLGLPAQAQDKLKVGFIYVGPIGDFGWSYQHDQGRLAIEKEFGDKVETTYVESVSEGPDAERVIRQLAASGHGLIFTTSFGFMDPTLKVAEQFPDVKFEHATGYKRAPNLSTYSARFYEGRHVIGTIAGHMTKTNKIGYIASVPIPEVVRGINAATLAARAVNPDITTQVIWVNSWYDPGREADAAKALIAQGADIIMQHTDSPAPVQVAEETGVKAFGQASDMAKFGPNAQLTAIIDDWAPYYIERTRAVLEGTWESQDSWKGLAAGEVVMAPYANMPDDVVAAAKAAEAAVASGAVHPFTGPIKDRDGVERIAAGAVADDGMLLGMDWFVEGVEGDLPK
ncbi:BMP family ABC transporter substrate-binding protein [Limibaculum sp. FT325]|uniref:BMP family ABC transporter substrate-binding protein n=1 Tax=Thermohalobaculum sediminis TaxID=2939436 RepID=UPI0020BE41E2|nr:BMP family ABC transporter substrate-binding protein [Limibaculum sediminis]MCL5777392.1 BMP family ABC transporter substrate-binding protein [Limibaculum sediminis]